MKPHVKRTILPMVLSITTLAACGDSQHDASTPPPPTIEARTASAERVEIPRQVEVQGIVRAHREAAVSVRVMAMVTAVHVKDGDPVRAGQLLLEIDPQATKGQLAQAQGALSQARAALALAERNYERFRALARQNAASELEVDMAEMQFEQATGAVEQAEGAVAAASSVAGDTRLLAPFAGRVSRKMIDVGDLAAPGRPLMMIESTGGRRLELTIPESLLQMSELRLGDTVDVRIDARPDLGALSATVTEMSPGADPASHSVLAKLDLPIDDLATGAAGRARIRTTTRAAVAVPKDAIIRQGGLDLVVLRTTEGLAATRVVTLGDELPGDRLEVLSGLSGEETVLVGLATAPAAGSRVESTS